MIAACRPWILHRHLEIMHGLCQHGPSSAAQRRARADLDLPAHAVAAGRLQLPASADLLGLWRRSDRTVRIVGRRMDDAGADAALPALGHIRHRQCAARTAGRAMVSAVALWTLARRQRPVNAKRAASLRSAALSPEEKSALAARSRQKPPAAAADAAPRPVGRGGGGGGGSADDVASARPSRRRAACTDSSKFDSWVRQR